MEISTPLSVKFEKNNATKFLQVNTLKCQIWKKNATKILQVNTLKCQIWKKKCCDATTVVRLKVWSRYFT